MKKILLNKKLIRFLWILMCCISISKSDAQVSVTATSGSTGPVIYTTLSDAFTAINTGVHQGAVTISITGNTTEPSSPTTLVESAGASSYTSVLIRPSGGNFTINSDAAPVANRGIIELNGADNVTIDGDDPGTIGTRNLTIQAALSTATGVTCVRFSSNSTTGLNGADNNTVKNCVIIGSRDAITSTVMNYGINMSNYSTTSMTTGAYSSLNTIIQNNLITRCYNAIHAGGGGAAYPNLGLQILNNSIGSSLATDFVGNRGILITNSQGSIPPASTNAIVEGNDIRLTSSTGSTSDIAAIELGAGNVDATIRKNKLHDVYHPNTGGYGAYGIWISSATSNTGINISNNFIWDMKDVTWGSTTTASDFNTGILISAAATGILINHNTISLQAPNDGATAFHSECIYFGSATATAAEIQNNIFINTQGTGAGVFARGIFCNANANISGAVVDNNLYYTPGTSGYIGNYTSNQQTLANWQTATAKDAQSVSGDPVLQSSTNLHASSTSSLLESKGLTLASVTTDIDGDARPGPAGSVNGGGTASDIGADEFDGVPLQANDMKATAFINPLNNAILGAGQSFIPQASFTNNGSNTQTNVPVRYQIIDASNNIIYNDVGTVTSVVLGASATTSFTSTSILTVGTYTIRAIAQLVGDATSNNDTITGTVTVSAPLCGTYHVGAAQTIPFNNLASAVSWLNTVGVTCPVIFLLDDAAYNETGSVVFNQNIPGVSAVNTVTVKPNVGTTTVLTGNVSAGAFISVRSNNIVLDGSNTAGGTTRDLTITNTSITTPTTIAGYSTGTTPLTNVTIKNTITINGVNTSTPIVFADIAGTGGYFNNITVQNNSVQKGYNGIFVSAVAATGNGTGFLVTRNDMSASGVNAIRFTGVVFAGVDGGTISNNTIGNFSPADAEIDKGINITTGTINSIVRGNTISGLNYTGTSTYNTQGILVSTGVAASNVLIDSNIISSLASTGTTTTVASLEAGIFVTGATGGVTITKNRITDIKNNSTTGYAAYGIHLNSSSATSGIIVANNFIADIMAYGNTTLARNGHGIYLTAGGGYNIYYNSIHLTSNPTLAGGITASITVSSGVSTTAASIDIRNNIFSNAQTIGTGYAFYSGVSAANNANVYSNLDYNNYYNAGANLAYFSAATQLDIAALQSVFSNANSIQVQPLFNTATDLHLQNAAANVALDNMGTPTGTGGIVLDIDDQARPAGVATDMGADEFTTIACSSSNGGTAMAAVRSICVTGSTTLSSSGYSSGIGTAYQWEYSTDGVTFLALGSETNPATANTGTISDTMYYRLAVTCSAITGYSSVDTVFVSPYPNATINPATPSPICAPSLQTFTAAVVDAANPLYQWRMNNAVISGASSSTYGASASGSYDVIVMESTSGCADTAAAVSLTVNPQPSTLTVTPGSLSQCAGAGAFDTISVTGGVSSNVTILNEDFNAPTNTWTTVNNTTGGTAPLATEWTLRSDGYVYNASYPTAWHSNDNTQFYMANSDVGGNGNNTLVTLTSPAFSTVGYNTCALSYYQFYRDYDANDTASVEVSTDGVTWNTVQNFTSATGGPASNGLYGNYSAFQQVNVPLVGYENMPTLYLRFRYKAIWGYFWGLDNVRVSGDQPAVYTWAPALGLYDDALGAIAYTGGNNDTVYAAPAVTTDYTVTVTNSFGCANADTIHVTINQAVAITSQPTPSTTVCTGGAVNLSVGASNVTGYQWYNGTTMLVDGANISGATTSNLVINPATPADNGYYTAVLFSGAPCGNDTTNVAAVGVGTSITGNTISASQSICIGSMPAPLTGSNISGLFEDFTGMTSTSALTQAAVPSGWTLTLNQNSLLTGVNINSYGRAGGNGAIRANNYNVNVGNRGQLDSKPFGPSVSGDSLRFDVAYGAYEDGFGPYVDTLRILTSTGSGYTLLKEYTTGNVIDTSSDGITTANAILGTFLPTSSQWTTKRLALPGGTTNVRFEFGSGFGNRMFVDAVTVDSAAFTWLSSTTSATAGFTAAAGTNTNSGYTPPAVTQNTWYKRVVNTGAICGADTSAAVVIAVSTPITGNTINASQTICSGSIPAPLTGSITGLFEDFTGMTSTSALTQAAVPSGWTLTLNQNSLLTGVNINSYGRAGGNGAIRANNYNVNVGNRGQLDSKPFGPSVSGDSLRFDVAYGAYEDGFGPYVDTLRVLTSTGSGYTLLKEYTTGNVIDTSSDGITTANAILGTFLPTSSQWTTKRLALPGGTTNVRFEFGSGFGNRMFVDAVTVDSAAFTWLSSTTNATTGFTAAAGTNTNSGYTPPALTQTTWYRRLVNTGSICGTDTSVAIQVTVDTAATIITQPLSVLTLCTGGNIELSVVATHTTGYQWYNGVTTLVDGGNISGATTANLLITNANTTDAGSYTVEVTSVATCGDDTSNASTVTVNAMGASLATSGSSSSINQTDGATNTYSDALCGPIAIITDANGGNTLGSVTAAVTVDGAVQTANGQPYLQRHYVITPASNGGATLVIYAMQLEFDAYNTAAGSYPLMPATPLDPNASNVRVTKYSGTAFSTPSELITPTSVTWNSTKSWWEISINVTSFSSFYIHTGAGNPLMITLRDITATNVEMRNRVDWSSSNETNADRYELERSFDGISFDYITTVKARNHPGSYSYWDENPAKGINYYRLKMYESNGEHAYSKIVNATVRSNGAFAITAYPNPVSTEMLTVEIKGNVDDNARIMVMDMAGKMVSVSDVTGSKTTIRMDHLAAGTYFIRYTDAARTETIKVNKQ